MKFVLSLLFLGLMASTATAQQPEVIKYGDLSSRIEADSDTLYVVNFWATWCRPCVLELPYFDAAQAEFADQTVKVLLVSLDFVEDYDTKLLPFLKRRPTASEVVLLDEPKYNTWLDKVSPEWSGALPATIFVKTSSDIRVFHEGDYTQEELFHKIESLIQ